VRQSARRSRISGSKSVPNVRGLGDALAALGKWRELSQRYKPGERFWVKVKNRDCWRYPLEREAARNRRRTPSTFATRLRVPSSDQHLTSLRRIEELVQA
jgi:hypothetical protein